MKTLNHSPGLKYAIIILFLAIAGYWEITLLQYSLKDDVLSAMMPWKYFYGECLQRNILPLWNPYQQTGYPIHADMQYSLWYPESWLIGFFTGYTNITFHLLFAFYIYMAGLGMYRLSRTFRMSHEASFLAGSIFMLSGIFIGHAQSMVSMLGAVWLPWAISEYIHMLDSGLKPYPLARSAFFTFLMISGGYQAVTIILFYLFIVFFLAELIRYLKTKDWRKVKELFLIHVLWLAALVILSAGIFTSLYYVIPHVNRLSGVSFREGSMFPFSPQSLATVIFPFISGKDRTFFDTDISITNFYFGLTGLVFFLRGLFLPKQARVRILLVFGLISLILSFGSYTPVWKFVFQYIPLMNLFKYPCFFRFFSLIAIILVIAQVFDDPGFSSRSERRKLAITGLSLLILILPVLIVAALRIKFADFTFFSPDTNIISQMQASTLHENLLLNAIGGVLILLSFVLIILFVKKRRNSMVIILTLADLLLMIRLNMFQTGCCTLDPFVIRKEIEAKVKGFPVPQPDAIGSNTTARFKGTGMAENTAIYAKTVSFEGYTSFYLKNYHRLKFDFPELRDSLLNYPVIYFDPVSENNMDTCMITLFEPGHIEITTLTQGKRRLNLLQSNYPGWKVTLDGKTVPFCKSGLLFMATQAPAGTHRIIFHYDLKWVRYAFYIAAIAFVLLSLYLLHGSLKKIHPGLFFMILLIAGAAGIYAAIANNIRYRSYLEDYLIVAKKTGHPSFKKGHSCILANVDNPWLLNRHAAKTGVYFTNNDEDLEKRITDSLCLRYDTIHYIRMNRPEKPLLLYHLLQSHEKTISLSKETDFSHYIFSKGSGNQGNGFTWSDDLETPPYSLSFQGTFTDTAGYSGSHSNRMNEGEAYTAGLKKKFSELPSGRPLLIGMSAFVMQEEKTEIHWVVSLFGKNVEYHSSPDLSRSFTNSRDWFPAGFAHILDGENSYDSLLIYFYKPGGKKVWLDDAKIKITPLETK